MTKGNLPTIIAWLALNAALIAGPTEDGETGKAGTASQDTSLRDDFTSFMARLPQEFMLERPTKASVPRELRSDLQALRARLEVATQESLQKIAADEAGVRSRVTNAGLPPGWGSALIQLFRASAIMEWDSFEECQANLKRWWNVLQTFGESDPSAAFPEIAMRLYNITIETWLRASPSKCVAFMQETEATLGATKDASTRQAWAWSSARFAHLVKLLPRRTDADETGELERFAEDRLRAYRENKEIPLKQRTESVQREVSLLYTRTRVNEAIALLNAWEAQHPDVLAEFSWLSTRYYVYSVGLGNADKAVETFHRIEALITSGKLEPRNEKFTLISDRYYRNLPEPILSYKSKASSILEKQQRTIESKK